MCIRDSYDSINNEFHQVFFGGMAEYYRDSLNQIVQDPLVPFVKSVSCLTRKHNGHFEESLLKEESVSYTHLDVYKRQV